MCQGSPRTTFGGCSARGTLSNVGLNGEVVKNVRFSTKNWPNLGNGNSERPK